MQKRRPRACSPRTLRSWMSPNQWFKIIPRWLEDFLSWVDLYWIRNVFGKFIQYIYICIGCGAQKQYDILCVPAMAVHLVMHPRLHFVCPHSVQVALSHAEASSAVQFLAESWQCFCALEIWALPPRNNDRMTGPKIHVILELRTWGVQWSWVSRKLKRTAFASR